MARKTLSKKLRFDVFKRDGFKCQYCGITPEKEILQVDHIIPVAEGGENDMDNLYGIALMRARQQLKENIDFESVQKRLEKKYVILFKLFLEYKKENPTTDCSANTEIAPDNVVFKILKTDIPDIYNLYCQSGNGASGGGLDKYGIALVPNIRVSHYLYNGFKGNPNNLDMRVECRFSKVFEKWAPVRFVANEPFTKSEIEKREEKLKKEKKS